ncbi:MAG: ComEC/Rec2 family competence protein, partial [Oscillospiraceae bacterium]|nr:ComEC/Rec2 family competence protein [Oscillospiraceae bacterium]
HVAFLVTFIILRFGRRPWALCISIPVILLFMAMVGFSPSVTRAGIMQIILLAAELSRREADRITTLSFALLLLIIVNPFSAASASLQLSFAAVLGLILISQPVYDWLLKLFRAGKCGGLLKPLVYFLASSISASVGALAFTVPLSALYFGYVSLAAPLSNLLILPAASLTFCGGLVSVLLGFIVLPLGKIAALLISLPANYIVSAAGVISSVPFASIYMVNVFMLIWIVWLYAVVIAAVILKAKPRQLIIPASLLFVCLCGIAVGSSLSSRREDMSFTALDVGQGQSIVVTSKDAAFVVDCGSASGGDAGNTAADYLLSRGRDRVDILFLTHYDTDHTNGLEDLISRVDVYSAMLPPTVEGEEWKTQAVVDLLEESGTKVSFVCEDTTVELENAGIGLFPIMDVDSYSDKCLCLLFSSGDWDALITGDLDYSGEHELIDGRFLPDIELLIAGHHGSRYSTSMELLERLRPETAVISVGYNTYGHPSEETLRRLELAGVTVYRTDLSGNITINVE